MIKTYYRLAKPGIIYGNAITALAGFFLASRGHLSFSILFGMLAGLSLVIGSGCVVNNYLDREIDSQMERTKKRALVTNEVPVTAALIYAAVLLASGSVILGVSTNNLTLLVALAGFFAYVFVYGYFKRRTSYGTIVGSVAGAVPPVVGYCAVKDRLDGGALLLFLVLVFWQMPHFYSIAIFRLKDYRAARIPVLPLAVGIQKTKVQIMLYIVAFTVTSLLLAGFGYSGWLYALAACLLGGYWFWQGLRVFQKLDNARWARKMFGLSLITITLLSAAISVDSFIR